MDASANAVVQVAASIAEIEAAQWDACANPDPSVMNPFVSHAFLKALEDAGTVTPRTGWMPRHLALQDADGAVTAVMPCYLKGHSRGEYVFDQGWAEAYEQAGGDYYPKLLCAVPFTPVPGPRLLAGSGPGREDRARTIATAAVQLAQQLNVSSLHVNFLTEAEWQMLAPAGFLQRTDQQFHWRNAGYATFDDFLADLASRKRKAVRKERLEALSNGLTIELITGSDITEAHWDAFFAFYQETGSRKWGRPYLNRKFFSLLGEAMADRCLLIMARRGDRYVAGALNMIGGDCLYGRYWGAIEHHPYLHFEICYYQAIDFAIAHGLARVEAGAQGDHKLARGYMPTPTYSSHWIADRNFRRAVARYLDGERRHVAESVELLAGYGPFRKTAAEDEAI